MKIILIFILGTANAFADAVGILDCTGQDVFVELSRLDGSRSIDAFLTVGNQNIDNVYRVRKSGSSKVYAGENFHLSLGQIIGRDEDSGGMKIRGLLKAKIAADEYIDQAVICTKY